MSITSWIVGKGISALGAKIMIAVVAAVALYVGALHLRLHFLKADRDQAKAAFVLARDANATLAVTVTELETANRAFADTQRLSDEAAKKLKERADEAQRNAERARKELSRLQELDRRAPDCAALLDRSLAACPDLVERLWPNAARSD